MDTFETSDGYVVVRLDRGDLVLESLETACANHGIDTGVVVSGIATFSTLHIHYVNRTDLPTEQEDRNVTMELSGSWEINSVGGVIADGEPHLHVTGFDGDRTVVGHLEAGCTVNVLGEFTIRAFDDLSLIRKPDENGVSCLQRR